MSHEPPRDLRLRQVDRVTTSRNEGRRALRCAAREAQRVSGEPGVVGTGQSQESWDKEWYSIPQGLLRAGSGQSQARRQPCGTVALSLSCLGGVCQPGKHRAAHPSIDERRDVTRGLQFRCCRLVRRTPGVTGRRVLNAPRPTDQNETADGQIGAGDDVQGDAGSERVTEKVTRTPSDGCPDGVAHQPGRRREVGAYVARAGMAGQVDTDECAVVRQEVAEGPPQACRLGESMQQDHRRAGARTALFDMDWHAR